MPDLSRGERDDLAMIFHYEDVPTAPCLESFKSGDQIVSRYRIAQLAKQTRQRWRIISRSAAGSHVRRLDNDLVFSGEHPPERSEEG